MNSKCVHVHILFYFQTIYLKTYLHIHISILLYLSTIINLVLNKHCVFQEDLRLMGLIF